mgnify:CR=1 FL=1
MVGIRDLFRWVGDGRESSSGQKGGGTKDLAVLELLFPGPWVTGGGRDERPRRSPFELRFPGQKGVVFRFKEHGEKQRYSPPKSIPLVPCPYAKRTPS